MLNGHDYDSKEELWCTDQPSRLPYLLNVGRAIEKLLVLDKLEIFDTVDKHNPQWESLHDTEAEKLDEARRALAFIQTEINELLYILYRA